MAASCRFCKAELQHTFVDLRSSPLANSYLSESQLDEMEPFFPLRVLVCSDCFLVQLMEFRSPNEIFGEYAYFSSYSDSFLDHCRRFAAGMIDRFSLTGDSQVTEIASNDGYLLQFFLASGLTVLGIEPAANVARVAEEKGIPTEVEFFGSELARKLKSKGVKPDLIVGNNVLAHVPELNDFVEGIKELLSPRGVLSMEFPHLLQLMKGRQFDTIYHEHFSYFSFTTVRSVFAEHGLTLFDVEQLPVHGGSLRILGRHAEDDTWAVEGSVAELLRLEREAGLTDLRSYQGFTSEVVDTKGKLVEFLVEQKRRGKRVAAYGAPAKGNTLLNYCGIGTDLVEFTVDRSPHKQGRYLPGSRIPICHPEYIRQARPDFLLVLPWNIQDEIIGQMSYVREWGCEFLIPIPELKIIA